MNTDLKSKILAQGMNPDTVDQQIQYFKTGFPFLKITAPATPGNGIKVLTETELAHFTQNYSEKASKIDVVKFVPASGAASRMFKDLFTFLEATVTFPKAHLYKNLSPIFPNSHFIQIWTIPSNQKEAASKLAWKPVTIKN
ncbi:DUF4301 family protein [Algoriphagus boritolerans]|uniref:DUF4301 family protein n=1 Tax=Algoriphagus boritolerans TaxID=308111 RepID=UPI000A4E93A0